MCLRVEGLLNFPKKLHICYFLVSVNIFVVVWLLFSLCCLFVSLILIFQIKLIINMWDSKHLLCIFQAQSPTMARTKCFPTIDAYCRLIALLVKHSGDNTNSVTKINLLNRVRVFTLGRFLCLANWRTTCLNFFGATCMKWGLFCSNTFTP